MLSAHLRFTGLVLIFLSILGCSSIHSRIKENPRQFNSYPPQTQAQIQNGRIDYGFTEDMVYLAKGNPDEKTIIVREGTHITVWKYVKPSATGPAASANTGALSSPYGYPGFGPGPNQSTPLFYERQYFKVEFKDGKVVHWDPGMQKD